MLYILFIKEFLMSLSQQRHAMNSLPIYIILGYILLNYMQVVDECVLI